MTSVLNAPISIGRPPLQVALAGDEVVGSLPIVVRRPTLREAQRTRSVLRSGTHDPARFVVALEIEVAIAPIAASARAAAAEADRRRTDDASDTIRYVGTAHGLLTLIRDIYAGEVADAVIISSLDGSATTARVRQQVLPYVGAGSRWAA